MDEQPINLLRPQKNFSPNTPPNPKIKWVVFLFLGILVIGILILRNFTNSKWPTNPSAYDPITLKPKRIGFLQTVRNFVFNSNNVITGQQEDRINILLLGIGGSGHDGPYLSDTNIILSIKPSTNQIAMISIPRDLAVKINDHGVRKINNADAFGEAEQANGGGEYARKIFEQTFGIKIPYYIRVDFTAFKEMVDAIGGLTINIERSFTDSQYPGPNDSYQTVSFEAGLQQINGERALIFSRSRHGSNGEDSDFARAKRQQLVLAAFKEKLLSAGTYLNPITLQKIISSLSKHIVTNFDFGQTMYLLGLSKKMNGENIKTLVLDDSPTGFLKSIRGEDGAYLLIPKDTTFSEIHSAISNIFEATGAKESSITEKNKTKESVVSVPSASIEILNGTWQPGLAAIKKQELEKDGLLVSTIGNSAKRPIPTTTIYITHRNTSSTIISSLVNKFNALTSTSLPEWLQRSYNASNTPSDIIIILGEDAR